MVVDADIAVVGAGPVGCTLAAALAAMGRSVVVLEAAPASAADGRAIALAWGSRLFLERLGVWAALAPRAAPITRIVVSQRGAWGRCRLAARDHGLPALGHVVHAGELNAVLREAAARSGARLIGPARVDDAREVGGAVELRIAGRPAVRARLVVAADGSGSTLRERAGIAVRRRDYRQVALVGRLCCERALRGRAYERFIERGAVAVLPLADGANRAALIWTVPAARAEALLALDPEQRRRALQADFGWRELGALRIEGALGAHRLQRLYSDAHGVGRIVLAGNAAQTVHPVAGQGFNLALRDVRALRDVLAGLPPDADPGAAAVVARYARRRRTDRRVVGGFTEALIDGFALPGGALRGLVLQALDACTPLRQRLAAWAMGLFEPEPRA